MAEYTEDFVIEAVRKAVESGELSERLRRAGGQDVDAAWALVADLESQSAELAVAYGQGHITALEWQAARGPLASRLEAARRSLASTRGNESTATPQAAWRPGTRPGMPLPHRRGERCWPECWSQSRSGQRCAVAGVSTRGG